MGLKSWGGSTWARKSLHRFYPHRHRLAPCSYCHCQVLHVHLEFATQLALLLAGVHHQLDGYQSVGSHPLFAGLVPLLPRRQLFHYLDLQLFLASAPLPLFLLLLWLLHLTDFHP